MRCFFKYTVGEYTQFLLVCYARGGDSRKESQERLRQWGKSNCGSPRREIKVLEQRLLTEKCLVDLAVVLPYISKFLLLQL